MKCESRVLKEYKTKKVDCTWPENANGPSNDVGNLPVCGGEVFVFVNAIDEPYHGGHSAKLELDVQCSKCKWPFWPGRIQLEQDVQSWDGWNITKYLEAQK